MFRVRVADNFHYMDKSSSYTLGEFDTYELAEIRCKKVVDESLCEAHEAGMTAKQLFDAYKCFGDDPYIVSTNDDRKFSAWDYAKQRCDQICGEL